MAKVRCRKCDICGVYMDEHDFQFHIRPKIPYIIRYGVPFLGMKKMELCEDCGVQLQIKVDQAVEEARSIKSKENV